MNIPDMEDIPIDLMAEFQWPICTEGYRWVSGYLTQSLIDKPSPPRYDGAFIVQNDDEKYVWSTPQPIAVTYKASRVEEKDDTCLTGFANIKLLEDVSLMKPAFLAYANKFGRLLETGTIGHLYEIPNTAELKLKPGESCAQTIARYAGNQAIPVLTSETLTFWCKEYFELRWAMWLYNETQNQALSTAFHKETDGSIVCFVSEPEVMAAHKKRMATKFRTEPTKESVLFNRRYGFFSSHPPKLEEKIAGRSFPEMDAAFENGEFKKIASVVLQAFINRKLRQDNIRPYWQLTTDQHGNAHPALIPTSNLSAIWLQFSQWKSGSRRLRRCNICNQIQDITGYYDSWHSHDSCKASIGTQYRRKKKAAEILYDYQRGQSIEQIMSAHNMTERKVKAQLKKAARDQAAKIE